MKINVSVVGRFHAFNLAAELEKRGYLNKLITTYPKFKVQQWGIPKKKIVSKLSLEIYKRYVERIGVFPRNKLENIAQRGLAKAASKYVTEADICIGWSGNSLEAILQAKNLGKTFILERGSLHYNYQMKIIRDEAKKQGFTFFSPKKRLVHSIPNYNHWQRELLEYELSDYISVPSQSVVDSFLEYGIPENKLIKNPYGVDLYEFYPEKKEDDIFRVIHCGDISLRKGIPYLLQAFSELNLENSELWLVGPIDPKINDILNKYQNRNIVLHGAKKQSDLYWYYSQCDIFCLASIDDGLAMVQAQAMACQLPIIATENTGAAELVEPEKNGFIVPIRDKEALKEKISYFYQNREEVKRMGKAAKTTIENGFSWSDYGDRYSQNLEEIFSKHF